MADDFDSLDYDAAFDQWQALPERMRETCRRWTSSA